MPKAFFRALTISMPRTTRAWSYQGIPLYVRKVPNPKLGNERYIAYYLADIGTNQWRVVRIVTITQDATLNSWQLKPTKEYVLDHIAKALRIVMLHEIKYNPLKRWSNTTWFYSWNKEQAYCVLFPCTRIAQADLRVQKTY